MSTSNPPPPPPLPPTTTAFPRQYRKGNWTLHETLVLITAKRLDDDRRLSSSSSSSTPRSAELRWKWVENHCWRHGCLRSQNQCNDKWDNLLRDYKKVRDYELKRSSGDVKVLSSYWEMDKNQRKECNLPSNLVREVFDALSEVLSRRNAVKSCGGQLVAPVMAPVLAPVVAAAAAATTPVKLLPEASAPETSGSSETEVSESGKKRQKKRRRLGSRVVEGASVLSKTLLECEEKREKRHRDMFELEERRLRMEEERMAMNRQGFAGIISAVNNLSGAIHALVSDRPSHHHHLDDNTR